MEMKFRIEILAGNQRYNAEDLKKSIEMKINEKTDAEKLVQKQVA